MIKSKVLRFIVMIIGFISLILGVIGIILPILPTTPFLLLTSFCFVKTSNKFSNWFLNTKIYKNHLENFAKNKVMLVHYEIILLLTVSSLLLTTIYLVNNFVVTIVLLTLLFIKYFYFIVMIKPISKKEYIRLRGENNA